MRDLIVSLNIEDWK